MCWGGRAEHMRLICPNCDAEYEVDDSAIPLTGRDVQCSNCGHSWFQAAGAVAAVEAAVTPQAAAAEPTAPDAPLPVPPARAEIAPPSSRLDAASLALLRDEAAREIAARRSAAVPPAVEVQADLGLQAPSPSKPPASVEPQVQVAPTPAPTPAPTLAAPPQYIPESVAASAGIAAAEAARTPPRRTRLPDIEEINSTLRPQPFPADHGRKPAVEASTPEPSVSFRTGFLIVIALAVLLVLAYSLGPQLGRAVPALQGPLATYAVAVDAGRLWLDDATRGLIDSLRSVAGPAE